MGVTVIGGTSATGGDKVGDLVQLPTNALYYKDGDKEYLRRGVYLDYDNTSYPEAISAGLITAENSWRSQVEIDAVVYTPYDGGYVVISQDASASSKVYTNTSFSGTPASSTNPVSAWEPESIATPGTTGSTIVVGGGYYSSATKEQVHYSTNGGTSWTASDIPNSAKTWRIACNDAGTLWLAGHTLLANEFYISTDGQSYTANTPSVADSTSIKSMTWSQSGGYFIITAGTGLYKTTDGITLTDISPSSVSSFSTFTAVSSDGTIYTTYTDTTDRIVITKSTNDGSSWTEVTPKNYFPYIDANPDKPQPIVCNMSVDGTRLTIGLGPSPKIDNLYISSYQFLYTDDAGSTWKTVSIDPFSYLEGNLQGITHTKLTQSYKGPNLFVAMQDQGTSTYHSFTLTKDPHNDKVIGLPSGATAYTRSSSYGTGIDTSGFGFVRIK